MHLPEERTEAIIEDEDERIFPCYRPKDIQWSTIKWFRYLPLGLGMTQSAHTGLLEVFFW